MPQYGYQAPRMAFDSTIQIPTFCGVPTLKSVQFVNKKGAIAFDSCNNRFYTYNPKTLTWSQVSGGGGSTDTTSLSNRINLKIDSVKRRRDSVFAYRNGNEVFQFRDSVGGGSTDTTSLSSRINLKLDSLKRRTDSVFGYRNGNEVFQFKDSVGGGGSASDTSKVVIAQVHNATATTLLKGEVVYLFGANGSVASVKRANNKQDSTSSKTFGIVRRDIASGGTGFITTQGQIEKLNLGSYAEGDILWLDSIDGQMTKFKPVAPYHQVFIGVVERANSGNGLAYVKPQNGYELGELHNVSVNGNPNNAILYFDSTNRLWKGKVIDSFSAPTLQRVLTRSSTLTTNNTITASNIFRINSNGIGTTRASFLNIDSNQINSSVTNSTGVVSKMNLQSNSALLDVNTSGGGNTNVVLNSTSAKLQYVDQTSVPFPRRYVQVDNNGIGFYHGSSPVGYTFPITQGTTGQVLKLSSASQLEWRNDSVGITDTTTLQQKSLPANSFMANNTTSQANPTATFFKDTSGSYTGTITWGGTAPTSLTATYRWLRIGRKVDLNITLIYANAGTTNTTLLLTLPSDAPTPAEPSGATSNSNYLYPVFSMVNTNLTTLTNSATRGGIRKNSGGTGYEIFMNFTSLSASTSYITTTYWTN
jgi:hypothetical protein